MSKNIKANRGPGRPAYQPKFPKSLKWTMADWCEANGINPKTGKGPKCAKLTLIKNMADDMFHTLKNGKPDRSNPRRNSLIIQVKDEYREPASKDGLGRKCSVFALRARLAGSKTAKTPRTPKVSVNVGTDYDAVKAALLAPTPAVEITAPVAEVTPEVAPAVVETVTAPEVAPALVS
jgi:hypothetical protein